MKTSKRLLAVLLAAVLTAACFVGCHKKDAVAATYTANGKTYSMPAGEYAMAVILADNEGRGKVNEELTDAEKNAGNIDYRKKTIDGKKFEDWVNARAEEIVYQYFYYAAEFDKNKLELSESDTESMNSYLSYQWSLSGYQYVCEPNGVSFDSFKAFETVYSYQRNALFTYLYGDNGPLEIPQDDRTACLVEKFALADVIEVDPSTLAEEGENSDELSDEEKDALKETLKERAKTLLEGYADRLNKGEAFSAIYYEHTQTEPEEEETTDGETSQPQDSLAKLYGAEGTSVENDLFETVLECEAGVATVKETESGSFLLILRLDVTADPYYPETYNDELLYLLKNDEFDKTVETDVAKLEVNLNRYECDYIKPSKIDYTEYNTYMASLPSQYGD